jgi:predicted nucleic acid-binding protein
MWSDGPWIADTSAWARAANPAVAEHWKAAAAAQGAAGAHRVRIPDALIAAAAADCGFSVLHYDHHFDRLATVLSFDSQWIAPSGTIP